LRDVAAHGRATTIRNVCAQLINDRQSKELSHSEMSRVERGTASRECDSTLAMKCAERS
jgi:hypothetical protein